MVGYRDKRGTKCVDVPQGEEGTKFGGVLLDKGGTEVVAVPREKERVEVGGVL